MYNIAMQFLKKNWHKIVSLFYAFIVPTISFAQLTVIPCETGKICNPISQKSLTGLIQTLLKGVLQVGIPIIALAIIYCGFLFVSARGNSEKLGKAKDALLYTLIGAAILLGSWAIAQMISTTVLAL